MSAAWSIESSGPSSGITSGMIGSAAPSASFCAARGFAQVDNVSILKSDIVAFRWEDRRRGDNRKQHDVEAGLYLPHCNSPPLHLKDSMWNLASTTTLLLPSSKIYPALYNNSRWRPFVLTLGPSGSLDFVLRDIRVLRLCDPRRNLKSPKKSDRFDTSGSPKALLFLRYIQKSKINTEIKKSKTLISLTF